MSTNGLPRRPESIALAPDEQARVLAQVRARHAACGRCGNADTPPMCQCRAVWRLRN